MRKEIKLFVLSGFLAALMWPQVAQAIERDSDGYYLIGSTADYEEFCNLVNSGNPYASARVTADGINVTRSIGAGDDVFHYRGKFDGQGHTLVLNNPDGGLFANTEAGCVISNVNLTGQAGANATMAGSLVNHAAGTTIDNCSSDATIDAANSEIAGGLVGKSHGAITLNGCTFTGQLTNAAQSAGLIGWNEHTAHINNCQVVANTLLAGNLIEGANIVENCRIGDQEVTMTLKDEISEGPNKVNTTATKVTDQGVTYSLDNGQATVTGINNTITAVTIPESIYYGGQAYTVTKIGSYALSNGTLQYVKVPATVTRIEDDAFHECTALNEVVFADGASKLWLGRSADYTFVEEELFYEAPIKKVYIGRNLAWNGTGYKDEPFERHETITEVTFGPRVTVVGNIDDPKCSNPELFNECNNMKTYSFLGDEQSVGTSVKFYCAEGLGKSTTAYIDRDLEASKYTEFTPLASGYAISDKIANVTYGPHVTYVTAKMYSGIAATVNNELKTVDLSKATRLTTIKERAFADCDKLEKVDFSNTSLKTIEKEGFYDCDKLANVVFGTTVESIGQSAFDDCGLVNVILPGSLKHLGYKAFYDCDEMTSLSLMPGEGEVSCGWEVDGDGETRTFDSCGSLKKLYMNRTLNYEAFTENASPFYDSYFEDIVIDNNVTRLGEYMFKHSNKLKSLSIGNGITGIPSSCFDESTEVANLYITDSETPITLGNSIRDFKVQTLYIGRPVTDVSQLPKWKGTLECVEYGDYVSVIEAKSYDRNNNIKILKLPAGITVEQGAFKNCGIENIYVEGDATFQSYAFWDVNNIQEITVLGKLTVEQNAIYPNPDNIKPIKTLNVFFKEDPKDESHPNAFPQAFLNNTTLNNLYDTPYQKVDFTCLPWSGFKNRNSMIANDYAPTTEVMANGSYDHAYLRNEHKAGNFFGIKMPFDVSTYYFGADAEIYEYGVMGFQKDADDEAMTLTTKDKYNLDAAQHFFKNQVYLIRSKYGDNLVKGTFDQFDTKQVNVYFQPAMYSDLGPTLCHVSGKDEVINPSMGNLYVLDNGYLKKVNGDYTLPAFSVAFKPDAEKKLHFIDSKTGEKLITDDKDVTTREDLLGYVSFYSEENSYAVDVEAEVYTVSQGTDGLVFNLVRDNVVSQGQGVIIKYKKGETFNMQIVTNPSTDTEAYQANVLKGVEVDTPVSDLGNIYVLGKAELAVGFYPYSSSNAPGAGAVLPANRAYIDPMDVDPDALPYVIDYDVPTSINGINVDGKNGPLYDLSGRRVFNPEKGNIYIKNGQKYIQK